jgi:predicted transcriptional regulator
MNRFYFETVLKLFTEMSEKRNVQGNSIRMNVTYSALFKWVFELQKLGLLEVKKVGRENRIKFTERGKKLAVLFKEINNILEEGGGKSTTT